MNRTNPGLLFLAIPDQPQPLEMSLEAIRAAWQDGQLPDTQLIWNSEIHEWRPAREFDWIFNPSAPMADTVPTVEEEVSDLAPGYDDHESFAREIETPQPRVYHAEAPTPRSVSTQTSKKSNSDHLKVKENPDLSLFKIVLIALAVIILGALTVNYVYVDRPLAEKLKTTSFAAIPAYAHWAAFFQQGVIIIHLPPSPNLSAGNFADFLVALAQSTPPSLGKQDYALVAITPGWFSRFVMKGKDWHDLGELAQKPEENKINFVLYHLYLPNGTPLWRDKDIPRRILLETDPGGSAPPTNQPILPDGDLSHAKKLRDKAWNQLASLFIKSSDPK